MECLKRSMVLVSLIACVPSLGHAGVFEIKLGYSYARTNFNANDYNWNRLWSVSFGYYITRISRIEISYANQYARSVFPAVQSSEIADQYTTLNWVQGILPSKAFIHPYLKAGAGQLNRDANVSSSSGLTSRIRMDSLTFVLGAGLRVPVSETLGVEAEVKGYIVNYDFNTWKDNLSVEGGIAFYF